MKLGDIINTLKEISDYFFQNVKLIFSSVFLIYIVLKYHLYTFGYSYFFLDISLPHTYGMGYWAIRMEIPIGAGYAKTHTLPA